MSKLSVVAASVLVASMVTGCGAISAVDNARSGYQAMQAYKTAKGMRDAQPVFSDTKTFSVTANLMPRDEAAATDIERTFVQLTIEKTQATAEELGLDLAYCEFNCPADTVRIQFNEKGREGLADKIALGDVIGGNLYLSQRGNVIEENSLDLANDYAEMAISLNSAITLRLAKTAQESINEDYNAGKIDKDQVIKKSEEMIDLVNSQKQIEGPLIEILKGKV